MPFTFTLCVIMPANLRLITLPQTEDVTINRISALYSDLESKDPVYIMLTVKMLADVMEGYEGWAAENAYYRLLEAYAYLEKGFDGEDA